GSSPPVEGMTLSFSMLVLTAWMLVAFILSYFIFTKRDVY
ncbi:TPA: ABC transporter permease, partial [Listeria monocytogenes]|nr:ABC transporter permease [Listeria monocytogenes]